MYVHKNEAQQTVDAAALAGAKAFVTSGYTSTLGVSTSAAQAPALAAGQQTSVAGSPIQAAELTIAFPQTTPNTNPIISVVFTRTAIPTFFATIFGVQGTTVKATAQAEAYNPSGGPAPVQVDGVKPWLVPNCSPNPSGPPDCSNPYFIDPTTGNLISNSLVGSPITLVVGSNRQLTVSAPPPNANMQFYPLDIPENPPTPFCASSSQVSCGNPTSVYHDAIACFNPTVFTCGESLNGPSDPVFVDSRLNSNFGQRRLKNRTNTGTQCLIPASGMGLMQGQDRFSGPPVLIQPAANNPNPALASAQNISRSDAVVTVPLFDGSNLCASHNCSQVTNTTVVGFLQIGIQSNSANGSIQAMILNVSGCNPSPTASAVSGGSASPVPVRLIGP